MLKYSDNIEPFLKLVEVIDLSTSAIGSNAETDQIVKSITIELKEKPDQNFLDMVKLWEQAS